MAADSGDGGESGGSETELVTLRMEQAMIEDLDSLDFPSRSHAIREATGSKVLERRLEEQRADGIDRLIAAYRAEDTSLDFHEYAFHSLAGPSVRETDQGYIGSARLEYGGDEFYGFGESFGDAAGDIVDTVYREARERASQVYGFDL